MKKALLYLFLTVFILLNACTISQEYGPYMGRVVDKDTSEPIEGAVVLMTFFVDGPMDTTSFADAVEVLTDEQGDFQVPLKRLIKIRPMHEWLPPKVLIFKPGYGAFPSHKGTLVDKGGYVSGRDMIVKLPKLKNREEEVKNIQNVFVFPDVPVHKRKMTVKLKNNEARRLGLMFQ